MSEPETTCDTPCDGRPAAQAAQGGTGVTWRQRLWRWGLVAVLVAGLAVFLVYGVDSDRLLSLLHQHHEALSEWVGDNLVLAVLAYMAIYIVAVAFSVPGATVLTLSGGFLFGQWWATLITVIAATLGATALFLIARTAIGEAVRQRAGPFMQRMEAGFRRNAMSYLLFLRLIPAFPFFAVNLVPAFLGVPLRTFFIGTLIGIIPGTFVYASFGAGIGRLLEAGSEISLGDALSTEVILGLCALAALSLAPVALKLFRRQGPQA